MKKNIPSNFDFYKDQVVSGEYLIGGIPTTTKTQVECPEGVTGQCCYIDDADQPSASSAIATLQPRNLTKVFGVNTHISVNPITGVTTVRKVSNRRF